MRSLPTPTTSTTRRGRRRLETGWSEKELLEGYAEVIRTIMTNYFNHLVGTDLDLPAAPPLD